MIPSLPPESVWWNSICYKRLLVASFYFYWLLRCFSYSLKVTLYSAIKGYSLSRCSMFNGDETIFMHNGLKKYSGDGRKPFRHLQKMITFSAKNRDISGELLWYIFDGLQFFFLLNIGLCCTFVGSTTIFKYFIYRIYYW